MMINHELKVFDQDSSHIGIDEVLENYIQDEHFDIPSLTFRLSDFKRIDGDFGSNSKPRSRNSGEARMDFLIESF